MPPVTSPTHSQVCCQEGRNSQERTIINEDVRNVDVVFSDRNVSYFHPANYPVTSSSEDDFKNANHASPLLNFSDVRRNSPPPDQNSNVYKKCNDCLPESLRDLAYENELTVSEFSNVSSNSREESTENLTIRSSPCRHLRREYNNINFILTNARSLAPKIESLITTFEELDVAVGIVTESWLKDSKELDRDLKDLELGRSIKLIYKNRTKKRKNATRYNTKPSRGGGVAIVFNCAKTNLKENKIKGNTFELVSAVGKLKNTDRHIYFFAMYVPPKMKAATFTDLTECIINAISDAKSKHKDPVFILGGDMNKRDFSAITRAFPDILTSATPPSRGNAHLDLLATNVENFLDKSELFPPLRLSPE